MYEFTTGAAQIMGILNITPDSFSDGGNYLAPSAAVERAVEMEKEGADILDIGAQSTRPGSSPVPPEEELRRLLPVLEALRGKIAVPISVDTFYPEVALAALKRGAAIVNDVSGIVTREMAGVVREHRAGWVLMHNGGGADAAPGYTPDVVTAVRESLRQMVEQACAYGVARARLCVDPGIGFGKSREDDLELIARTKQLKLEGTACLVGASRKRVTGEALPPSQRLPGTIAAHAIAQLGGADILRVHDVAAAKQAAGLIMKVIGLNPGIKH